MEIIYILLPVHNRKTVTERFIDSLQKQTYVNYHLVLLDDGSTDGTAKMVAAAIPSCTVITGSGNWWWAGALQQGYRWLKSVNAGLSDLVLIMNDDTEFAADFLEIGTKLLLNREKVLLLARCFSKQTGRLLDAGVHVDWRRFSFVQATISEKVNCLSTRGLFLRMRDFFDIGGFYPTLLPHYTSDYEFTIRARRKGMQLMTDPSLVLHLDEETTGFHTVISDSRRDALKHLFSRKSVRNPISWSIFILLSCPLHWKFVNLVKVGWELCKNLHQIVRGGESTLVDSR
jgi:GT2 family glycosyltransferase